MTRSEVNYADDMSREQLLSATAIDRYMMEEEPEMEEASREVVDSVEEKQILRNEGVNEYDSSQMDKENQVADTIDKEEPLKSVYDAEDVSPMDQNHLAVESKEVIPSEQTVDQPVDQTSIQDGNEHNQVESIGEVQVQTEEVLKDNLEMIPFTDDQVNGSEMTVEDQIAREQVDVPIDRASTQQEENVPLDGLAAIQTEQFEPQSVKWNQESNLDQASKEDVPVKEIEIENQMKSIQVVEEPIVDKSAVTIHSDKDIDVEDQPGSELTVDDHPVEALMDEEQPVEGRMSDEQVLGESAHNEQSTIGIVSDNQLANGVVVDTHFAEEMRVDDQPAIEHVSDMSLSGPINENAIEESVLEKHSTGEPINEEMDVENKEQSNLQSIPESIKDDELVSVQPIHEDPIDKEGMIDESTNEVTNEVTNESTNEVTNEITNEVTNESTNEVTNESTNEVTNESTNEVTNEITNEVTNESTNESTVIPITELESDSATKLTKEQTSDLTNDSTESDNSEDDISSNHLEEKIEEDEFSEEINSNESNEETLLDYASYEESSSNVDDIDDILEKSGDEDSSIENVSSEYLNNIDDSNANDQIEEVSDDSSMEEESEDEYNHIETAMQDTEEDAYKEAEDTSKEIPMEIGVHEEFSPPLISNESVNDYVVKEDGNVIPSIHTLKKESPDDPTQEGNSAIEQTDPEFHSDSESDESHTSLLEQDDIDSAMLTDNESQASHPSDNESSDEMTSTESQVSDQVGMEQEDESDKVKRAKDTPDANPDEPVIPQGDAQDDLPQKRPSQSPSSSAKREHRLSSGEARVGALHLPHL